MLVAISSCEDRKRNQKIQEKVDRCSSVRWLLVHMNVLSGKAGRTLSEDEEAGVAKKVDAVLGCLMHGDRVVVHCHAGLHRTGFFLYVLLRRHGLTLQEALEALKMTRRTEDLSGDDLEQRPSSKSSGQSRACLQHAFRCVGRSSGPVPPEAGGCWIAQKEYGWT